MKYYLKEYEDGFEYSPVGSKINNNKLANGFTIVDQIPQSIKDKEPGGKDFVEPVDPKDVEIQKLKDRLTTLEAVIVKGIK